MAKLLFICLAIICINSVFCSQLKKKSKADECFALRNRAFPTLYLAPTNTPYNNVGYIVQSSTTPFGWCFKDDLHIYSPKDGYVIDIADVDVVRGEIIVWPQHQEGADSTQNQKWTHTQYWDNENSFKIQAQIVGNYKPCLALDDSGDAVLKTCNMKDASQDWFFENEASIVGKK